MTRNREVKALLDRGPARPVVISPLARDMVGHGGTELAAVEIAKAIATDFRTDLRDHIISLDLLGSTVARHYVPARPQCPACGRKKLREPGRAPVPIELGTGAKLMTTSGGYRTVSSRATVERFRKHVSPLTGVVSRLENPSRSPAEHKLLCHAQFFIAARDRRRAQGRMTERMAGGAAWANGASDCATDFTATLLMPSALKPVISCRRDMPLSRYCLISSFMAFSSPACLFVARWSGSDASHIATIR